MSIVTLNTNALQTPVALPGAQTIDTTSLFLTFTGNTPVTLAITGPNAGAFVAELFEESLGRLGEVSNRIATTGPGGGPTGNLPTGNLTLPKGLTSFGANFQINFTAPPLPAHQLFTPQQFTATLGITWPGGGPGATVTLTGTTAQITRKFVFLGAVDPGSGGTLEMQIGYATGDSSTLNVQLAASPTPPPGITIKTVNASLPAVFGKPEKILEPLRTKNVNLAIGCSDTPPPSPVTVFIQVSAPEFPQLDPALLEVTFPIATGI